MKRTFVAIKIHPDEEFRETLMHFRNALAEEKIKWTEPGNMHITLRFLGDTDEMQINMISGILEETAEEFRPFDFSVQGAGVFKNFRSPRVIWLGLEDVDPMEKIKKRIDYRLAELGIPSDEKTFRPHLTIGRVKFVSDRTRIRSLLEEYESHLFLKETAGEILFFESTLTPGGPVYEVLSRHLFGK